MTLERLSGTTIPPENWVRFSVDETLIFYDGPRAAVRRTQAGQGYLAWWCESDETIERWLYVPLTDEHLATVLGGDETPRHAIQSPDDTLLVIVDYTQEGEAQSAILTKSEDIPISYLPESEVRIQVDKTSVGAGMSSVMSHSEQIGHDVIDLIVRPSDGFGGGVRADLAGRALTTFQHLIDSIGQAIAGRPTTRAPIRNESLQQTRLEVTAVFPGSLGLRLEARTGRNDLFDGNLASASLNEFFELLRDSNESSNLADRMAYLQHRVYRAYESWLNSVERTRESIEVEWASPELGIYERKEMTVKEAGDIRETLSNVRVEQGRLIEIDGSLDSGSLHRGTAEIHELGSGDIYQSRAETAELLAGAVLDGRYRFTLEEQIATIESTGEISYRYLIVALEGLPSS